MRRYALSVGFCCVVVLGGCSSSAVAPDAGVPVDAGPGDAGSPVDAGPLTDAGPTADAGPAPDAGPTDAGGNADSGSPVDAGGVGAVMVSPSTIDFGQVPCGTTSTLPSASRTVTLTNGTGAVLHFAAALGRGAASPYTLQLPGSNTIAAGASATVVVIPSAIPAVSMVDPNLYGDQLTLTTDAPNDAPHRVALLETALGALVSFDPPTPIDFGLVPLSATPSARFAVRNDGNAPVSLTAAVSNASIFFLDLTALGAVFAGSPVLVNATFAPATTTYQTAAVSLSAGAGEVLCAPLPQLALSGTGSNRVVFASPAGIDFGAVACGARASAQTVVLQNLGVSPVTFNASLAIGTAFQVSPASGTLTAVGSAGATQTLTVTPLSIPAMANTSADAFGDTLLIADNSPGDPGFAIPLHETAYGAILVSSAAALPFGSVSVGAVAQSTFVVSNLGSAAVPVSVQNADSHFSFAPQDAGVGVQQGIVFTATFQPTGVAAYSDSAQVAVAPGAPLCYPLPAAIAVSGTGAGDSGVAVTPGALDFGLVPCGTSAAAQVIAIVNQTASALSFTATLTQGAAFYGLSAADGGVAPGAAFPLVVTPSAIPATSATNPDLFHGEVTIATDAPGDLPHLVALHETAYGARLIYDVTQVAFPPTAVGTVSNVSFLLINDGNATGNVTFTGFTTPPFTVVPDSAAVFGNTALSATASFAPGAVGTTTVNLSLTTSDALCLPLPQPIPMTGTGQ